MYCLKPNLNFSKVGVIVLILLGMRLKKIFTPTHSGSYLKSLQPMLLLKIEIAFASIQCYFFIILILLILIEVFYFLRVLYS